MIPVIHKTYQQLPSELRGCVLAIGNFDGVHKGHQALMATARDTAQKDHRSLAVLTFDPHPRRFFNPAAAGFQLTSLSAKCRRLGACGAAHVIVLPFDQALASMTAADFMQDVLSEGIGASCVVTGESFSFGTGRSGNVEILKKSGLFDVLALPPVRDEKGMVYSSTRAREALATGDMSGAADILGYPWEMEAPVIHGDKRGRAIGYPTANQEISAYTPLPFGIYAVRVRIEGEDIWRPGAASFGIRPMFEVKTPLLETYIFDFDRDIYGKILRVAPAAFLRPEMNFPDVAGLTAQMRQDCQQARSILQSAGIQDRAI